MSTTATNPTEQTVSPEQQQKLLATGSLFHALAADPRYRKEVLGLIKKAAPETPIPELDLESSIRSSLEEQFFKPKDEENKKLQERLESIERRMVREKWMAENKLNDEEAVEIEELAKKEQIGNGNAAVELWRSRQNLGTPRGTRKTPPGTEEFLNKLSKVNPNNGKGLRRLAEEEATRIFAQTRKAS